MPSIADTLTVARFPLGLALALAATLPDEPSRITTTSFFVVGAVTDLADGPIARRLGTAGPHGARLDSAADAFFTACTIVALLGAVGLPDPTWVWWCVALVVAGRLVVVIATFVRFRVVSIAHTTANRASGATVGIVAVVGFWSGTLPVWGLAIAGVVAAIATADEARLVASASSYDRDAGR
jgi:CDP-diacylglycerol--glycerol-3-phosphate 3-phosphatidyltransferase